ncbi:MAG: hypothetical protein WCZ66_02205 [Sphingomonadaceae bacterium]
MPIDSSSPDVPGEMLDERIAEEVIAGHTEVAGGPDAVHETFLGLDSTAWVAISCLIFVAVLWKVGAFRAIGNALDSRATKVRADLAEAASLRAEAEALKAKAAADAAQAEADAKAVIANAEVEAKRIVAQATEDAETAIRRRTRLAEDRIAAEGRSAEAELRARAAEITVKAAQTMLAERSKRGELSGLVDTAIAGLDRR